MNNVIDFKTIKDKNKLKFKKMLESFLPECNIEYQKQVLNYTIDFYINDFSIVVEYNEDKHKIKSAEIMEEILTELVKTSKHDARCIDIEKGKEIEGIDEISEVVKNIKILEYVMSLP